MNKLFKMMLMTLILGLSANVAHSQTANVRSQIEATLRIQNQHLAHKDVNGYLATVTDDFKGTDIHGKTYDKKQLRQSVIQVLSLVQSIRRDATVTRVTPSAGGVTVLSADRTTLKFTTPATHTKHVIIFDSAWRSLWVKTSQGWRRRRDTQLSETITTDGKSKVVPPSTIKPKAR